MEMIFLDRFNQAKKVGILGILGNLFLLIIKGSVGIIFKSQAMIADSANSASDIFASFMTYIGNKISSEPSDDNHNFGHGKAEYIFSLFISISMIVLSINILITAIKTLLFGNDIEFSWLLVVVCIITIILKFALYLHAKAINKSYENILVSSTMNDHRNDCFVTIFTLISILFSLFKIYIVDSIVGIGISLLICFTGLKIFVESFKVLMDTSIDETSKQKILSLVKETDGVKNIDNFSSVPVGYQYFIFITICVDGNMSTFESHSLADKLEEQIAKLDKVYKATIHVHPV